MHGRSLIASFRYVWEKDPALDKEHPDYNYAAFTETRDLKHLPTLPGRELAIFDCRPLTARQFAMVSDRMKAGGFTRSFNACFNTVSV